MTKKVREIYEELDSKIADVIDKLEDETDGNDEVQDMIEELESIRGVINV